LCDYWSLEVAHFFDFSYFLCFYFEICSSKFN
jgi:hypothetical protein